MRENGTQIRMSEMARVNRYGLTVHFMKDIGSMTRQMEEDA
jgi:hypothetical protein